MTPRPLLRPILSLHESKGSMTPWKSHLCGTMALPSPCLYYLLPCICVPSFAIDRSASAALWRFSESTSFLTNAIAFWVAEPLRTRRRFLAPFDHLLQYHCVLLAVLLGRWKDRLQLSCMASAILLQGTSILFSLASLVATFAYSALSSDLPSSLKRM
ncbi:hypothetical protein BHE74_00051471 [Ensete ventricosum]|nr:hypothetical protein BHE74_00051471 [Ensete ventricosum]